MPDLGVSVGIEWTVQTAVLRAFRCLNHCISWFELAKLRLAVRVIELRTNEGRAA